MYGFSDFACSLNEEEEGIAPTDSRLRPDQRIMEQGDFDSANKEKVCVCVCVEEAEENKVCVCVCVSVGVYACNRLRLPSVCVVTA